MRTATQHQIRLPALTVVAAAASQISHSWLPRGAAMYAAVQPTHWSARLHGASYRRRVEIWRAMRSAD
jgi:hypothetical protein